MKRTLYFVMALALVLGLSQCKKEQPATPQNGQVRITLNVENGGNNGSRVNVDPTTSPMVTFEKGDQILVGYNGAYVGTLTHNGTQFEGSINVTQSAEDQPLYFYFLGNKTPNFNLDNSGCTVSISDQTKELPVLSMGESINRLTGETVYYSSETTAYEAQLHNKCALVKFPLANAAGSIKIGGMNNEATISFASHSIAPTGNTGDVRLYSISNTEKWAILLPQAAVPNAAVTIGSQNLTVYVPKIEANALLNSISTIQNTSTVIDLSSVSSNTTVEDGAILTGTLGANVKISIAAGATVTLDGVSINANGAWTSGNYAGITCEGNATIILKDGTENIVRGFYEDYPGISIPENRTLTIKGGAAGTGKLTASPYDGGGTGYSYGAGIGGGYLKHCGNIEIQGGDINATGGSYAAGIGGGESANCGTITISGGTVTATGGEGAAGIGGSIGSSYSANCGTITISGGTVTATGGDFAPGIGSGFSASCDAITISGGTVTATGGEGAAGIGGGESANCGDITITTGVTSVTATKGENADISIGVGDEGTCGKVTIGGVETGFITESPYTYEP